MARRPAALGPRTLTAGPWLGVLTTDEPYDDGPPNPLVDALNMYAPDSERASSFAALPGFSVMFNAGAVYTSASKFKGQGVYAHFDATGTVTNFIAFGGHLFRVDPTLTMATDVTPIGVAIDGSPTTRLTFLSTVGALIISDGIHRPWIASSLASTPIVGNYVDYDGNGVSWAVTDETNFGGSAFYLLNQLNGGVLRSTIAWTEPGQPTTGLTQPNFSNFWNLSQTEADPIYAIFGTENNLYFFRQRSIGTISGAVGPNLQQNSTKDAIAFDVGTVSPQTIFSLGDKLFFTDAFSRPWMLQVGSPPVPIWKSFRQVVNAATTSAQTTNQTAAVACIEPTLNLYVVGPWTPDPVQGSSPTELYAFDALTGQYMGRLQIGDNGTTGVSVDALGVLIDGQGRAVMVALGSSTVGGSTGYAWSFNGIESNPEFITLNDKVTFLTTNDGRNLTTNGQTAVVWKNVTPGGPANPTRSVTTERVGYAETMAWNADRATFISTSASPVGLTVTTPSRAPGTPLVATPTASQDGTYRAVWGLDAYGRGLQFTLSPTEADDQWTAQRLDVLAIPSTASPEDA